VYTGLWVDDLRHGRGDSLSPTGKLRYVGSFVDDRRHAAGTITVVDTPLALSGTWDNDTFNGSVFTAALVDVIELADDVAPKLIVALTPAVDQLRARADAAERRVLAAVASAISRLQIGKLSPMVTMLMPIVTGILIVVIVLAGMRAHMRGVSLFGLPLA